MQMIDNVKARIERVVGRRPWLDHVIRAAGRYRSSRGDHYAAGITYFTVLSLFPLLMVAFAIAGFVLAGNQELFDELQSKIVENVPGEFGTQINDLVDQAVESRGTVGVLGLLTGLWTGLGWMANLRAALTDQWEGDPPDEGNFLTTKLSDLGALIGLGLALVLSLALSAVGSGGLGARVVEAIGLGDVFGMGVLLRLLSIVLAVLATWAVYVWIIARLPRTKVTLASAAKAGLLAAVAFELFKYVGSIYLRSVLQSPAGATFGSIIGLMVFSYITYRIILFATAWAATTAENELPAEIEPPAPAVIRPRGVDVRPSGGIGAAAFGAGALTMLALTRLRRR
ncbi:inner membrane protein YhjD [Nocardia shimofusensis]|uniref:inner membrane protein YhjD n=1 Tax=Nocardia shimofusensis TaxID=228596 RepID=UPI000A07B2EB|nr:inner membrane protein YhjD [Nocardia shimofusensis]